MRHAVARLPLLPRCIASSRGLHEALLRPIAFAFADVEHLADAAEAEGGHVDVDALVVARADAVRLVPDADVAARADAFVERAPRWQVRRVAALGVIEELIHRTPILQHDRRAADPLLRAEKAELGLLLQLLDHLRHRERDREPPV